MFDSIDLPMLDVPFPEKETPNKKLLDKVKDNVSSLAGLKYAAYELMAKGLDELESKIREDAGQWKEGFSQHKKDYDTITAGHGGLRTKELNDQIEHFEKKRFEAQSKLKSIELAATELNRQMKLRKEKIAFIQDRRGRIATLRAKKVKEILKSVPRLRISLKPNSNRESYMEFLDQAVSMKGSHQKPRIIESICNNIDPFQLAELIRSNDHTTIKNLSKTGDWAQRILEQFRAEPSTSYEIETVPTDDYLEIALDVNGEIRPLEKLSVGQKATVIVSLSLVEGSSPVLFDQPEDALYSPFIVEHIVHLVKASKDKRQFIFATHNPNIAVGPDLDLGIILEGSSSETAIKASGAMDDAETNKLVVLYLEGGEDAIRGRLKEYGFIR
jgi:hypothetical protein